MRLPPPNVRGCRQNARATVARASCQEPFFTNNPSTVSVTDLAFVKQLDTLNLLARRVWPVSAKWGEFGLGLEVVVEGFVPIATLTTAAEVADGNGGFGVDGKANGAGVDVRLFVDFVDFIKNSIGLRPFA